MKINVVLAVGILLSLYMAQGLLYPSGSIISQSILLIILIIGIYSFLRTLFLKMNNTVMYCMIIFYLMVALTFIISPKTVIGVKNEAIGVVSTMGQFKGVCTGLLPFFVGYYASTKKNITDKTWIIIGCIYFVVAIATFFFFKEMLMLEQGRDDVVNNAAYRLVVFIPFIPIFFKSNKFRLINFAIAAISVILIILGSKRGAILCMIISLVFSVLYYMYNTRISIQKALALLLFVLFGIFLLYRLVEANDYLMYRLEQTQSVGIGQRSIAYKTLFNHWLYDSTGFEFLFGGGTCAAIEIWGNYAHNDWLELLSSNGLFGVLIYAALFVSFIRFIYKTNISSYYKLSMYLSILLLFMESVFSMGYMSSGNAMFMLLLGALTNKALKNGCDEKSIVIYR